MTPTPFVPTPTPIPIDGVPELFQNYMFHFFARIIYALKQIEIPFTHVTVFEVVIGSIAISSITLALKLMYGKGGEFTKHE